MAREWHLRDNESHLLSYRFSKGQNLNLIVKCVQTTDLIMSLKGHSLIFLQHLMLPQNLKFGNLTVNCVDVSRELGELQGFGVALTNQSVNLEAPTCWIQGRFCGL